MARIRRGDLASVREIMLVGTLPRQTVNRWLREERINLKAMRMRHLAKLHRAEEEYLETRSGRPRATRRQRWIETQRAVRRFNEANSKEPGSARTSRCSTPEDERAEGMASEVPGL